MGIITSVLTNKNPFNTPFSMRRLFPTASFFHLFSNFSFNHLPLYVRNLSFPNSVERVPRSKLQNLRRLSPNYHFHLISSPILSSIPQLIMQTPPIIKQPLFPKQPLIFLHIVSLQKTNTTRFFPPVECGCYMPVAFSFFSQLRHSFPVYFFSLQNKYIIASSFSFKVVVGAR